MGPTASGKTDLAIEIAKRFPTDIISVDSALVYRDMNIGTAKPEPELLAQYPHQLVDILSPEETYSAASFANDAALAIGRSNQQKRLPVLVGGTMLYYRALFDGLNSLPEADAAIRSRLNQTLNEQGSEALHHLLKQIDPNSAARIHPNDPQRITRALEVYEISGQTLSALQSVKTPANVYRCLKIVLLPENRSFLHQRIEKRFALMLEQGFIEELTQLRDNYTLHLDLPSMRSVGYRQVWQYLEGDLDYTAMQEQGIIATRQLAKRQHTWLRKEAEAEIFCIENDYLDQALSIIDAFV